MTRPLLIRRARVPETLLGDAVGLADRGIHGFADVDLLIREARIAAIGRAGTRQDKGREPFRDSERGNALAANDAEVIEADGGLLVSAFVDCHVHLDKGEVLARATFPMGDLHAAIEGMRGDKALWTVAELRRRAAFQVRSAYAHGVRALRSHVDWVADTPDFVMPTLAELGQDWRGRVDIQLSPLVPILDAEAIEGHLDRAIAAVEGCGSGVIGLFVFDQPGLAARLGPILARIAAVGLDVDFHVDEGLAPGLRGVEAVAEAALATRFPGKILCGHAVALQNLEASELDRVLDRASDAGLRFVSLPLTNLHLQDSAADRAPRRRGLAPIKEMAAHGLSVAIGCDNVRDGFFPYGDLDPLEALRIGVLAAQLDDPAREWMPAITAAPAETLRLPWAGQIAEGAPADLVLFRARTSSELMARPQADRIIIRAGRRLDASPPDFRELDEVAGLAGPGTSTTGQHDEATGGS